MIDLSSDTATRPTTAMRRFMAEAPVGDEQRREDPTVNELQEMVAELTGKEAALFLPSGTMCNLIAFSVHANRGEAVIIERRAHPYNSEAGGPAWVAGVMLRPVDGERGVFSGEQVRGLIDGGSTHTARTTLVSIENTTNEGGGKVWPVARLAEVRAVADEHGMRVHIDGARLMNAVVASGVSAVEISSYADSVWIDLSKGLGAPVGAVLAGTSEFIERARLLKHMFGGAMRQAGIIAAAGVYAFRYHVDRLAEDHANAKLLEAGLATIPGVRLVRGPVETNIIFFDVTETGKSVSEVVHGVLEHGIRLDSYPGTAIRMVTHLDVSREDCERAVEAVRAVVTGR